MALEHLKLYTTWKRKENNMDNNFKELLLAIANCLENIAYSSHNPQVDGYVRLIAQEIYSYLNDIEED